MKLDSDYNAIEREYNNIFNQDKRIERYKTIRKCMINEIECMNKELKELNNQDGIIAEMKTHELVVSSDIIQDGINCLDRLMKQTEEAQTNAKVRYLSETMAVIHDKSIEALKKELDSKAFFNEETEETSLEQAYIEMGWK